jgi:hypothetical protein
MRPNRCIAADVKRLHKLNEASLAALKVGLRQSSAKQLVSEPHPVRVSSDIRKQCPGHAAHREKLTSINQERPPHTDRYEWRGSSDQRAPRPTAQV